MAGWSGDPDEPLTLDEAAALIPGATADTLRRLIRNGKLQAYRPGKKYLTTRADVRAAVEATRVPPAVERNGRKETPTVPNQLGLTEMELSNLALEQLLEAGFAQHREKRRLEREQRTEARKAARKPPRTGQ